MSGQQQHTSLEALLRQRLRKIAHGECRVRQPMDEDRYASGRFGATTSVRPDPQGCDYAQLRIGL
jgi:hypothetical protein